MDGILERISGLRYRFLFNYKIKPNTLFAGHEEYDDILRLVIGHGYGYIGKDNVPIVLNMPVIEVSKRNHLSVGLIVE